ncbi:hypothetical protein NUTIK01_34370 [Novosphingobium sp. IK01]|uniref:Uncharacterized protein n=1 Tax=Novosphingobium pituita TaxID=3056842 RepID=A0ABQ6PCY9_9SPHN|nr:hypothetical protein NUTIK01_34370 [Novosphingobium sp. IK01]
MVCRLCITGGITIVRDYVAGAKLRSREVFIPLSHKPGHAQVDFGEADGIIDGKLVRPVTKATTFPKLSSKLTISEMCA